ncbi:C40 family peptidase [Sinosporangium album]|nr:C40 family peptidase [Sinosporangium album]
MSALVLATPLGAASADPQPTLQELSEQVEKLHENIATLSEQYNGERIRLKEAQRTAAAANKTLSTSESELQAGRRKAALLAQNAYMTGGLSMTMALTGVGDPDSLLNSAATLYALEQQQGEEVNQVARAMAAAEKAKETAKTRSAEVKSLVTDLAGKRDEIRSLVAKVESNLFRRVMDQATAGGRAVRVSVPIIGEGKAAQAARWAMTQQLKPYIWGAEGAHGYDCSGLVMWAYQKVGIRLPHYTGSQWTAGKRIPKNQLRAGDLVFFYNDLHHVGIYIGSGLMVHAPRTGDVVRVASIANRPYAGAIRIAN